MVSNNTDWGFGETNSPFDVTLPVRCGSADIPAGSAVYASGSTDKKLLTVSAVRTGADDTDDVVGVTCYDMEAGKPGLILIYGITRPRNTCGTDVPLGGAVANDSGRLAPAHATTTSRGFAVNIGGALEASSNDTGLVFVDTIAGLIGGRAA